MVTERQLSAAHDAWERTIAQWRMYRASTHRLDDTWVLENKGSDRYDSGETVADEVAEHRFLGVDAERRARFFLRDVCLRAALEAAHGVGVSNRHET